MATQSTRYAKCLSILGTGSDVGKSVVVTALCRIFSDLGVNVAPFKAQNMSNNSFVTVEGAEMGRAQIAQAQAARLEPVVDMNPVLLKPCSDTGAQVVVHGRVIGTSEARHYFADTDALFAEARTSLDRLRSRHELIVMEGAGSCAEVNLRPRDFVNFRIAHAAEAPVLLVADIDRGGVFAQIVGSLDIIPEEDRRRVRGFVINRFRGDAALFDDGIAWIERRTALPVLGLVPYFRHIEIESEDGMPLDTVIDPPGGPEPGMVNIAVIRLPHISNFTDFDPLRRERGVNVHYLARARALTGYDLVVLPGCKNVRSDLDWLRETGWDRQLSAHVDQGGRLGGICGGYQMLGRVVRDPDGAEGAPGETSGLELLDLQTTLAREKVLTRTVGVWNESGLGVTGYEIHMGYTEPTSPTPALISVTSRNGRPEESQDGSRSEDGLIWGTYLHGLFDEPAFRRDFIERLCPGWRDRSEADGVESIDTFRDRQYDLLAEHFRRYLDMPRLLEIVAAAPGSEIPALDLA